MDVVFAFADRIIVLARGRLIADGDAETIRDDPKVQQVYFGTGRPSRSGAIERRAMTAADARGGAAQAPGTAPRRSSSTCRSTSAAARWWR